MIESPNHIEDGLLAVADSIDKLAQAVFSNRKPESDVNSPLRVTVAHVAPANGWRVLAGEVAGTEIVYSQLPMLSWIVKINHALGSDDIVQVPLVWDAERQSGVELAIYLESRRCISPGISSRILAPGQESLAAADTADFEAEIRATYQSERRAANAEIEALNKRIFPAKSHRMKASVNEGACL